jgi:hypothetical protein
MNDDLDPKMDGEEEALDPDLIDGALGDEVSLDEEIEKEEKEFDEEDEDEDEEGFGIEEEE